MAVNICGMLGQNALRHFSAPVEHGTGKWQIAIQYAPVQDSGGRMHPDTAQRDIGLWVRYTEGSLPCTFRCSLMVRKVGSGMAEWSCSGIGRIDEHRDDIGCLYCLLYHNWNSMHGARTLVMSPLLL